MNNFTCANLYAQYLGAGMVLLPVEFLVPGEWECSKHGYVQVDLWVFDVLRLMNRV